MYVVIRGKLRANRKGLLAKKFWVLFHLANHLGRWLCWGRVNEWPPWWLRRIRRFWRCSGPNFRLWLKQGLGWDIKLRWE